MKTKLLISFLLLSLFSFAQTPINSFYINNDAIFSVVSSANPIDQSVSGANLVWNFNDLTSIGQSQYTNTSPTPDEVSTFPNTNAVIGSTDGAGTTTSQLFTKNVNSVVSITGLLGAGLELNFITNNATLGAFPMNYGFSNTDNVAGTYNYDTFSGTFTGTIVTTVDAYGTLNANIGSFTNANATRLKTVINISLNYGFFTNVGTITQTTYSYYNNDLLFNVPLFRTATTSAVVPLASIDQTDTTIESFSVQLLKNESFSKSPTLQIAPNPVVDVMNIQANNDQKTLSVSIADLNGRIVLNSNLENTINVSSLQKGIYIATITTDKGTFSKKMIKN
jgi:Secretion system C-terminal sorting domain